eukprot:TRINITY_DN57408_c0_g1_i1.p1 TRINITY_DN57408_c0_g1~~TRINITY_DN57408_c0_g1_i1.p1  ORF type:complete len:300 (+),score=56.12 TRINITY_DN57408_c0_g1_i1:72-902(+)
MARSLLPQTTAWEPAPNADHFLLCLFKKRNDNVEVRLQARKFINDLEQSMKDWSGKIQLRSDRPENWDIIDGRDNFIEPNHMNPAIFDFDSVLLAGFRTPETVHTWWNCDQVFELMKWRDSIEKMGIFTIDGLLPAFDLNSKHRLSFGDKLMLFEFFKLESFRPMQAYLDGYKRFAASALKDCGTTCNLLFGEGISSVLMNEFPVEAACASSWRTRSDMISWYDSHNYQKELFPLRYEYARYFTLSMQIFEDRLDELNKAKKAVSTGSKLKSLMIQ